MGRFRNEMQKVDSSIKSLTCKIEGIEIKLCELQKKTDEHEKMIHDLM